MNFKNSSNCSQNKICEKKENLICSLHQVENFLCNFKKIVKGIKLYHIFRS